VNKKNTRLLMSTTLGVFTIGVIGMPILAAEEVSVTSEKAATDSQASTPSSKDKKMEGKCGEGKCGEGKCGANMSKGKGAMEGGCGANMRMDAGGMVMNENLDNLPSDCKKISEEINITVRAGAKFAKPFPGTTYGFDKNEYNVPGCSKITVRFINEDSIRHQWMVHNLPKYLYPQGMYHMEVNGPGERTGTFIVPSVAKTYLVHCDLASHMEKGMKAQLKVNGGDGNLPGIPGISKHKYSDKY